jgi:hypothetical protein
MLISYSRPKPIAWSLIGDGSAWLSDDAGSALTNGRPAAASRLQWLSGAQTTDSVLALRGSWSTGFAPRVVGLIGLSLPVGTLISLAFRRPADADYSYLADTYSQRVVQLPDGSRCAWLVLDAGVDAAIGIEYRIANDVDGASAIAAGAPVDVGEAWVGPAVDVAHEVGWARGINDPTVVRRSRGGQAFGSVLRSWRTLQARLAIADEGEVRGNGLANASDWELVEAALAGGEPCVAIPRWRGQTADYLQRTALFAIATQQGNIQHAGGSLYGRDYSFEEVPAAN